MMKHKLTIITTAALLAACSSPPRVATPSGDHRVPINKTDPAASYYAAYPPVQVFPTTPAPTHPPVQTPHLPTHKPTKPMAATSPETDSTVADLKKQIANLKAQIAQQKTTGNSSSTAIVKPVSSKALTNNASPSSPSNSTASNNVATTPTIATSNYSANKESAVAVVPTSNAVTGTDSASNNTPATPPTPATAKSTASPITVWALPSTPTPATKPSASATPQQPNNQSTNTQVSNQPNNQTNTHTNLSSKVTETTTVTTSVTPPIKPTIEKKLSPVATASNNSATIATVTNPSPAIAPKEVLTPSSVISEKPPTPINKKLAKLLKDPKKQVVMHDESVTFTVHHEPGQSTFHLPKEMKIVLLDLAKTSQSIEVRGYTDTDKDDEKNNEIALSRAVAAYDFLVQNGVTPNQIYVSYENSGYFTAENNTSKGKARNRRVEIEVIGSDTTYLR